MITLAEVHEIVRGVALNLPVFAALSLDVILVAYAGGMPDGLDPGGLAAATAGAASAAAAADGSAYRDPFGPAGLFQGTPLRRVGARILGRDGYPQVNPLSGLSVGTVESIVSTGLRGARDILWTGSLGGSVDPPGRSDSTSDIQG